jgi:hypothetical protein
MFVIETDKELERTAPFTARKLLQLSPSLQAVDMAAGSFYEPVTDATGITISIHTTDGSSPNLNPKYRYEVAVRKSAINAYNTDNNKFENLWVRGYGTSYGLMPSGANAYFNKIIFGPGSGVHHTVIKNGTINNSLFLPGTKNTSVYAVVFYNAEGLGKHNKISNSVFIDVPSPIYTHTSYGSNFGALELDNVAAFAEAPQDGVFLKYF